MAHIYGKQSRYLIFNDLYYLIKEKFILIIGIILILILLQFVKSINSFIGFIIFIGILFIIKNFIDVKSDNYRKMSGKYYHGRMGEYNICDELKKLPDEHLIFQDVVLPGQNNNIDFVVLGPVGIYIVEVKSHKGEIDFNGQELTLNGRPFEKNILKQAMFESLALRDYIKEKVGKEYFINRIIVFSSPYASLRFGLRPINNVVVIGKKFLLEYFREQQISFNKVDINTLKEVLMTLVK